MKVTALTFKKYIVTFIVAAMLIAAVTYLGIKRNIKLKVTGTKGNIELTTTGGPDEKKFSGNSKGIIVEQKIKELNGTLKGIDASNSSGEPLPDMEVVQEVDKVDGKVIGVVLGKGGNNNE